MTWEPSKDWEWREKAAPRVADLCERNWHDSYRGLLTEISEFTVSRIEGTLTRDGQIKWADCKADCVIYFDRVPLFNITVTNPQRVEMSRKGYPQLREYLEAEPDKDSLPIVLKRIGGRFTVWDGHHRLRTYEQAKRLVVPAIVAWIIPGSGMVKAVEKRR